MKPINFRAAPPHHGKAGEAHAEQRDGRWLGYRGGDFGDDDLAVTHLKIGDQDLVDPCVERTAAATGSRAVIGTATATTTIPATATTTATDEATTTAAATTG
ncbi:MAG: hypothetical protein WA709_34480 [Stellaceae bacterium]